MRKVQVKVEIMLSIIINEGTEISEIIDEMEHEFSDTTGKAIIEDSKILDYEIRDSK